MSTHIAPSANGPADKNSLVQAILCIEMPLLQIARGWEAAARQISGKPSEPNKQLDGIAAREAELNALTIDQLRERLTRAKQAEARAEEARRFYNAPQAWADFNYWLRMDFWSLDEAVALLVKRDPRVVTKATIEKDLAPKKGLFSGLPNPPTAFTKLFMQVQHLAERSNAMTASLRLTPLEAIRWGHSVLGKHLPQELLAYLDKHRAPVTVPATDTDTDTDTDTGSTAPTDTNAKIETGPGPLHRTKVKRAALLKLRDVWPSVEGDLSHSDRNGLREAAKAPEHGMWWEEAAMEWARARGCLVERLLPSIGSHPPQVHRLR